MLARHGSENVELVIRMHLQEHFRRGLLLDEFLGSWRQVLQRLTSALHQSESVQMGYITLSSLVATISVLPATLAVYSYRRHHPILTYVFAHAAVAGFAVAIAASPPLAPHTTGMLGKVCCL